MSSPRLSGRLRPAAPPPTPGRTRRRPSALTVVGLVLVIAGLSCLGWVGYQLLGTNVVAERHFDDETSQLRSQWSKPTTSDAPDKAGAAKVPGNAIALLRIPRFGSGYEVPIVQGTTVSALSRGVGHYTDTADPGAIGNFAIAGHRITHGQPFSRLLELDAGDQIVVETRTTILTYKLDTAPRDLTVPDTASWVLDPVPGKPDATPTARRITLTTCQDLFHSPDRSVAFGTLVSAEQK